MCLIFIICAQRYSCCLQQWSFNRYINSYSTEGVTPITELWYLLRSTANTAYEQQEWTSPRRFWEGKVRSYVLCVNYSLESLFVVVWAPLSASWNVPLVSGHSPGLLQALTFLDDWRCAGWRDKPWGECKHRERWNNIYLAARTFMSCYFLFTCQI